MDPERGVRGRSRRHDLANVDAAVGAVHGPVLLRGPEGVAVGSGFGLVQQDAKLRPPSATSRRIAEAVVPVTRPPLRPAWAIGIELVVDLGNRIAEICRAAIPEPPPRRVGGDPNLTGVDGEGEFTDGLPVPEPLVDPSLAGPEDRQGFARRTHVGELSPHESGEHSLAACG